MDRRMSKSIWWLKEMVYWITSLNDARSNMAIPNQTDASKYATGAVLTQLDLNGDRHPISFISKTFSPAERNYEIYNHELLAIIQALEEWQHYIQGSPHTTIILFDHKNLNYYREAKKLNRRQARWSLYLLEFDVKLVHSPGNKMVQSDTLSWRPVLCPDEDNNNEDIIMLPDDMFLNLIDINLQEKIAMSNNLDGNAMEALKLLLIQGPTTMTMGLNDWTIETQNGWNIQFYKEKNYFPKIWIYNKNFYDHETAGHLGEIGTYNAVWQQWPGLHTFVKNYVQGCGACQQFKIGWSPSKPAYIPTEGTKSLWPFANCSIDLITDLSLADGFDSILVMVDQGFSKNFDTMPQNNHFWRHCSSIIGKSHKWFGLPDKIISDRGP